MSPRGGRMGSDQSLHLDRISHPAARRPLDALCHLVAQLCLAHLPLARSLGGGLGAAATREEVGKGAHDQACLHKEGEV